MSYKVDERLFLELGKMEPADVCLRTLCTWKQDEACFLLDVWGHDYSVNPDRLEIGAADPASPPVNAALSLAIMHYLLGATDTFLKKEWISEKDIPGGEQFFRGPHSIPSDLIAEAFSKDLEGFEKTCRKLGGVELEIGDAAFCFRFLPRVPIAVALWQGDDEFEAQSNLFFDRTISEHLPLDVIFGIAFEVCSRITNGGKRSSNE